MGRYGYAEGKGNTECEEGACYIRCNPGIEDGVPSTKNPHMG